MTSISWAGPSSIYLRSLANSSLTLASSFASFTVRRRCLCRPLLHIKVVGGRFSVRAQNIQTLELALESEEQLKLVKEVKTKLQSLHSDLPVGKNGRDDDELLLWFLKDRKYNVDAAVGKLVKALTWRRDFNVDSLTEESVKNIAATGKAYLHTSPDVLGRPVVVVVAANHFPARDDLIESQKLCIYLIEKALSQLAPDKERILGIFDLRGFTSKNGDLKFVKFLVDVFFNYYPKRLDQVLFVEAPFIFQPGWNIVKPWLKSYASLVRFCTAEVVRQEYFTPDSVPPSFQLK
ncbi:hypothetical protein KP509_14G022200 [Ceratopteris richardii]|uniref:CRAL-TRIO domain-containing protein n=1 Tax=Ceratopteris richardii TaxID=49495 RepID=A0A8T2T7P8_CERRI|nr:hypothetical protein KP509_14G022200 [Ceratopteris richardii]KAH7414989.1 hypothetical protein KP509_14G022200 [Ceratopteris richardii]